MKRKIVAAWTSPLIALLAALPGCPKPVVPGPGPIDRPSVDVEILLETSLAEWARAHASPDRSDEYSSHLVNALDKAAQADAQGGGHNGLAKTILAKLTFEARGRDGLDEAVRLATSAAAEDKGFVPAHILLAELQLARRQGEMTIEALAKAAAALDGAQRAICWLEGGGDWGDPLPSEKDFYDNTLAPQEEVLERTRVIDKYLAFDVGNHSAVPVDGARSVGTGGSGGSGAAAASLGLRTSGTFGRLKASHYLAKLSYDLARFDFEGTPVSPAMLATYRSFLDTTLLGKLDPDCFEGKLELLKVQYRLATELPTRTEEQWITAFRLAQTMLAQIEQGGRPMIENDPRVRVLTFRVVAGYASFRISRFVELGDDLRDVRERKALYESVDNLTNHWLGAPGKLAPAHPDVQCDLLCSQIDYDLTTAAYYAPYARKDPRAQREFARNRERCELWLLDFDDVLEHATEETRATWGPHQKKLEDFLHETVTVSNRP